MGERDRLVGEVIRRGRLARGWSGEQAAEKAGVAQKTWARVENGESVRGASLASIAALLGVEQTDLAAAFMRTDGHRELAELLGVEPPSPTVPFNAGRPPDLGIRPVPTAGATGRIPITIDLEQPAAEPPPRPDGPAYADPNTVHAIQCQVTPTTVEQLQQVMRAQGGGGDLAAALAQLVAMGSFMFNQLSPTAATAWVHPGPLPEPVTETMRLLGFTEIRLGE